MTDETVDACPECGSARFSVNSAGGVRAETDDPKGRYYCDECGGYFNTPDRRKAEGHRNTQRGLARDLLNASPEEWP